MVPLRNGVNTCFLRSRPCGDGWFQHEVRAFASYRVPSLWGRMVPFVEEKGVFFPCPVPVGTDGSRLPCRAFTTRSSRPCGDGWFHRCHDDTGHDKVPSLWGRMVLYFLHIESLILRPVPVGTDGSGDIFLCFFCDLSRPCGDGWFCRCFFMVRGEEVPSLWGRMVPAQSADA